MRIAISVGHGFYDPGASSQDGKYIEHLEAYKIAWFVRQQLAAKQHAAIPISCFQSLSQKIAEVNRLHVISKIDLAMEIHFNSAESTGANGTEVLYKNIKNAEWARSISSNLASLLGIRDRGAKQRDDLGWLNQTKPIAFIIEVLFLSNASDANLIAKTDFHKDVARAIVEQIPFKPVTV